MFIGLTGPLGGGKGEVAKIFQKEGFRYISLSDIVRKEATKRKLSHTRENLQKTGNDLRKKGGAGVLGFRIVMEIMKSEGVNKNWVIDGIRNPAEIENLNNMRDFYLIGVTASDDILVKRILKRKRKGDLKTRKAILEKLEVESGKGQPEKGLQIAKCLDQADFLIINEGTLSDLKKKVEHFLGLLGGTQRPTFDEIFMEIAYTWSKRATCLRRKVGAVIAKDKQQLTAGYNGAPRGLPHCADLGGCLREKLKVPSGQRHEICRGTHAEQNVLTQAAKFGIDISGGTLYCNTHPCVICTKMIINAGIERVVYDFDYDDPLSKEILGQQKVLKLQRYEGMRFINGVGDRKCCCS